MRKFYIECHREGDFTADVFITVEAKDRHRAKRAAAEELAEDPDDILDFFDNAYVLDSCTEVPASAPDDHSPIALLIHALEEQAAGNHEPEVGVAAALVAVKDWWTERSDVG